MNCTQFVVSQELYGIHLLPTPLKPLRYAEQISESPPDKVCIDAIDPINWHFLQSCRLSSRELQVLKLVVDGDTNAEIAQKLFLSIGTVKTYIRKILDKLDARDRTQAAVIALRGGLVT